MPTEAGAQSMAVGAAIKSAVNCCQNCDSVADLFGIYPIMYVCIKKHMDIGTLPLLSCSGVELSKNQDH